MKSRLIVAGVCVPVVFVIVFFLPAFATGILTAAICGISAWELIGAVKAGSTFRFRIYATAAAALLPLGIGFGIGNIASVAVPLLLVLVLFVEAIAAFEHETVVTFRLIAVILFAGVVMPWLLSSIVWLRTDATRGRLYVLIPIIVAFIADGGAYFAGIYLGKKKIFPAVSPKKTLEGCLGGVAAGIVSMLIYAVILKLCKIDVSFLYMIIYGLVGAVVTEIGDLAFSLIKRQYDIKDFGTLLREHGGMMDRFDSMVFAAPTILALVMIIPAF